MTLQSYPDFEALKLGFFVEILAGCLTNFIH